MKQLKKVKVLYISFAALLAAIIIVTVTLICVLPSKLDRIEIASLPNKTEYIEGETLDTDGMVVKAYYGKKAKVVDGYTVDKSKLHFGDDRVTVLYSDDNVTKTASFAITVAKKSVTALEIVSYPSKLSYIEGEVFNPSGISVKATYDSGETETISECDYDKKSPLKITDKCVIFTYGGKSVEIAITVAPKILTSIYASSLPQKVVYEEGEYFDFLGVEIYADYENAPTELIKDWDYDKKELLTVSDESVQFSYCLHDLTKSVTVAITVTEATQIDAETEFVNTILSLLPPAEQLTENNLSSIEYVLALLDNLSDPAPEHIAAKENLEARRQEILNNLPTEPEKEYKITYVIADNLEFDDIDYGNNPATFINGSDVIELDAASSEQADGLGYVFTGWIIEGQAVQFIGYLTDDITVYAKFELTPTTAIQFKDYLSDDELLAYDQALRTSEFDFEEEHITTSIYSGHNVLPIAYFSDSNERINSVDLSTGKLTTVYVLTAQSRELHLADNSSVSLSWEYEYEFESGSVQVTAAPNASMVYVVPIGASVKMTAMHANVSDILIDGVSYGKKLNNSVVQAEFVLKQGEYAASVTFSRVINNMSTLSFVGYNQFSIVYPAGWDGRIAAIDLENLEFVYDETNAVYLTTYTINGNVYYFDDLKTYDFGGDTQIWVNRVRNSFSFTIIYCNGTEKIEDIRGKRTIKSAFENLSDEALETVNTIFAESKLYADSNLSTAVTVDDVLETMLRKDIFIYSDWVKPSQTPELEDVDYSGYGFVNEWSSLFVSDGNICTSEIILTADGLYSYKTFINGEISADISGLYRIENDELILKTLNLNYEYQLIGIDDIFINADFAQDGLLRAVFAEIHGTELTLFEHTLYCGNVRPVNYTNKDFIDSYELDDIKIELRANGTAVITYLDEQYSVFYRVNENRQLFIFSNGVFGTGELVDLIGGNENENQ